MVTRRDTHHAQATAATALRNELVRLELGGQAGSDELFGNQPGASEEVRSDGAQSSTQPPAITSSRCGGAIREMSETLALTVPIAMSVCLCC